MKKVLLVLGSLFAFFGSATARLEPCHPQTNTFLASYSHVMTHGCFEVVHGIESAEISRCCNSISQTKCAQELINFIEKHEEGKSAHISENCKLV